MVVRRTGSSGGHGQGSAIAVVVGGGGGCSKELVDLPWARRVKI